MTARATGQAEILERLAEAGAQVITRGLNNMPPTVHDAVLAALSSGARFRLIMDLGDGGPVEVQWLLVKRGGATQPLRFVPE